MTARLIIAAWLALLPARGAAPPASAFLKAANGEQRTIYIIGLDEQAIRFRESLEATAVRQIANAEVKGLFFFSSPAMAEAQVLFEGRKYAAARGKFAALREDYKNLTGIEGNPAAQAGFMELECLRRSGDLEGLAKALETFDRRGLGGESQRRQLDLYTIWDAVRVKDWPRAEASAREALKDRSLPGSQTVQAAYCLGQALEAQGKPDAAIDAYQTAMTADGGTAVEITREAALKALHLYRKDPAVIAAMKTGDGPGRGRLLEAAGLAELYGSLPGVGEPLPPELAEFLKFRPESAPRDK